MRASVVAVVAFILVGCARTRRSGSGGEPDALLAVCVGACQMEHTAEAEPSELLRQVCRQRCEGMMRLPRLEREADLEVLVGKNVVAAGWLEAGGHAMRLSDGTPLSLDLEQAEAADVAGAEGREVRVFGGLSRSPDRTYAIRVRFAVKMD